MSSAAASGPDRLLAWMDALADATRVRLLHLLSAHELGVVELCEVLQMPQSTVSRHLKVLADRGFVEGRRNGTANLYRMATDRLDGAARRLWILARDQSASWPRIHHDRLRLARRLRERTADARAFFAGAAGDWDALRAEMYGQAFTQAALLSLVPAHWVVADLGCGTGVIATALAGHVAQVLAIDHSPAMLRAARRRLAGLPNVEVRRGELEALPVDDASCDAALLVLALTYVKEPATVVREMRRILRPGGRAIVVDLLRHDRDDFRRQMGQIHPGFATRELCDWLRDAGLDAIACSELPPEPQAKGPALILATASQPGPTDDDGSVSRRRGA